MNLPTQFCESNFIAISATMTIHDIVYHKLSGRLLAVEHHNGSDRYWLLDLKTMLPELGKSMPYPLAAFVRYKKEIGRIKPSKAKDHFIQRINRHIMMACYGEACSMINDVLSELRGCLENVMDPWNDRLDECISDHDRTIYQIYKRVKALDLRLEHIKHLDKHLRQYALTHTPSPTLRGNTDL